MVLSIRRLVVLRSQVSICGAAPMPYLYANATVVPWGRTRYLKIFHFLAEIAFNLILRWSSERVHGLYHGYQGTKSPLIQTVVTRTGVKHVSIGTDGAIHIHRKCDGYVPFGK